jgi:hypothetical protein
VSEVIYTGKRKPRKEKTKALNGKDYILSYCPKMRFPNQPLELIPSHKPLLYILLDDLPFSAFVHKFHTI